MINIFWKKKAPILEEETEPVSRKPPNTAFRQQRLKSWQPILLPQSVLPFLILIACIFTPIGIGLVASSNRIQDLSIDYSKCDQVATNEFTEIPKKYVRHHFEKKWKKSPQWRLNYDEENDNQVCQLKFEIPNRIKRHVYVYYRLKNFYQNHRNYVQSFDRKQLRGKPLDWEQLDTSCKPLRGTGDKAIYPCGLIANSMFNDTFAHRFESVDDNGTNYHLTNKGISWKIDRKRFRRTQYNASQIAPPPNWAKRFPNGYTDQDIPNIHRWEEFQVWMRTAPFPKFYKLALKNESSPLPAGNYTFDIGLNYPISYFGGSKTFVLTTLGILGTRNLSMSIMFLIVAGLCALFALIFLTGMTFRPRVLGDHSRINFDEDSNTNETQMDHDLIQDLSPLREIL
ncbi:aminophospholipid translocase regulatory protein CDC50 KNAG_0I02640 [Huiozyma naganishii CBS 8797]|uniref:Cell cycle control protein n=1 Tax=Huiozyma naganishii (strain ATCC MYA-139 / BCRC 22969 / CBS 8797 / KCTC 17520 / NBRC 10181 / NCYC 3082 / Yp74L-3) TaxID=1071383 RepID=J7S9E3_HUIN7|nr:hypothetical protein KNAG_0I02640 [Kazachstania naganishii CBS 8797]CCK72049.1 hypothetical protein KNAG_0I02640 [Kazachstania naganishii CBS 8797]